MTIAILHHPNEHRVAVTLMAAVAALIVSLAVGGYLLADSTARDGSSVSPAVANLSAGPNVGLAPEWTAAGASGIGVAAVGPNVGLAPEWTAAGASGIGVAAVGPNVGLAPEWTAGG